jgi:hypothetical protein
LDVLVAMLQSGGVSTPRLSRAFAESPQHCDVVSGAEADAVLDEPAAAVSVAVDVTVVAAVTALAFVVVVAPSEPVCDTTPQASTNVVSAPATTRRRRS